MNGSTGKWHRVVFAQFLLAWLVIIAVAAFDTYMTVKHSPVMSEVEINPVGMLILQSPGGVPLMVGMKTAGVGLALLFSVGLWQWEPLRVKVVFSSTTVALLALGMVGFMHFDAVGIQTRRWAQEMPAPPVANTPPPHQMKRAKRPPTAPATLTTPARLAEPGGDPGRQTVQALEPASIGAVFDDRELTNPATDGSHVASAAPNPSDPPHVGSASMAL